MEVLEIFTPSELLSFYDSQKNAIVFPSDVKIKCDLSLSADVVGKNICGMDINMDNCNIDADSICLRGSLCCNRVSAKSLDVFHLNACQIDCQSVCGDTIDCERCRAESINATLLNAQRYECQKVCVRAIGTNSLYTSREYPAITCLTRGMAAEKGLESLMQHLEYAGEKIVYDLSQDMVENVPFPTFAYLEMPLMEDFKQAERINDLCFEKEDNLMRLFSHEWLVGSMEASGIAEYTGRVSIIGGCLCEDKTKILIKL